MEDCCRTLRHEAFYEKLNFYRFFPKIKFKKVLVCPPPLNSLVQLLEFVAMMLDRGVGFSFMEPSIIDSSVNTLHWNH